MKRNTIIGLLVFIGVLVLVVLLPILSANNSIYTRINFNDLKRIIKNEEFTFVYIGYASCNHCQKMQPYLADIHEKYPDKIMYYLNYSKLTTDEISELKTLDDRLSTMGTPTFLFIKHSEIIGVKVGATSTSEEFENIYLNYYNDPIYYTEINASEFITKYKSKSTNVMVIGQSFCSHCTDYKPVISEVAHNNDIDIYYLEYDVLEVADKEKIAALNKKFETFGTPYTIITKDNKIIDEIKGYVDNNDLIEVLKDNEIIK